MREAVVAEQKPLEKVFDDWVASPAETLKAIPNRGRVPLLDFDTELRLLLKRKFDELAAGPPEGLEGEEKRNWLTQRGHCLERLLLKLLALEGLSPNPSYVSQHGPKGLCKNCREALKKTNCKECVLEKKAGRRSGSEQIDGFFELDGRYFCIEAKWDKELPASAIYAFRGKMEGKLSGTLGVVISIDGFAADIDYGIAWGKEINIILVDGSDIRTSLGEKRSFTEMMRVKLREAALVGDFNFRYQNYLDRDT